MNYLIPIIQSIFFTFETFQKWSYFNLHFVSIIFGNTLWQRIICHKYKTYDTQI